MTGPTTPPPGATLDEMRNVAAREAERLAIWENADGRARRDRVAFEGIVRFLDAAKDDPDILKRVAVRMREMAK